MTRSSVSCCCVDTNWRTDSICRQDIVVPPFISNRYLRTCKLLPSTVFVHSILCIFYVNLISPHTRWIINLIHVTFLFSFVSQLVYYLFRIFLSLVTILVSGHWSLAGAIRRWFISFCNFWSFELLLPCISHYIVRHIKTVYIMTISISL